MNITQDVVTDLLPLYFSGEASSDTRAHVNAFFREHPDFEKLARRSVNVVVPGAPVPEAAAGEKKVLQRVSRTLRLRSVFLGVALFCTVMPLSVAGGEEGIRWFMLRDFLAGAIAFWALAIIAWGVYFRTFLALRGSW